VATWKETSTSANAKWVVPIALRIKEMVGDMGPTTIATDLKTLCDACWSDLSVPPQQSLEGLRALVDRILAGASPRFVLTGSRETTDELLPRVAALTKGTGSAPSGRANAKAAVGVVDLRLRDHDASAERPVHYGLVNNAGTSGVFVLSGKAGGLDELDEKTLTDELASRVFGGSGAHAFFMKTWGAGLAYSNGLSVNPNEGRVNYYAERCPDLVQTMTFVSDIAKAADKLDDPYLVEYCVANAVAISRESDEYEDRSRAAADDVVDGDTPARIARWRKAVLSLKDRADTWRAIRPRIVPMTGRVLPGVGPRSRDVEDGVFFTIAPEPMLATWERYVQDREGPDERVHRIYGRDFWIVP